MEHLFVTSAATAFSESTEVYIEDKKDMYHTTAVNFLIVLQQRTSFPVRHDDPRLKKIYFLISCNLFI